MMRTATVLVVLGCLLAATLPVCEAAKKKAKKKKAAGKKEKQAESDPGMPQFEDLPEDSEPEPAYLELTEDTLLAAAEEHKLMLVGFGVENCWPCEMVNRVLKAACKELKVKDPSIKVAHLTITDTSHPVIPQIFGASMSVPKLLVFREGAATDFEGGLEQGGLSKEDVVKEMLRQASKSTVQKLENAKQTERFLYLDSWTAQHPNEDFPPRVIGFFRNTESPRYKLFRKVAARLQGMISFGECFDKEIQKRFLGKVPQQAVVQVVKAVPKNERKITYTGEWKEWALAKFVGTHSTSLVQDITTEDSLGQYLNRGVPLFLILMPDSYEDSITEIVGAMKKVAAKKRQHMLFAYGFKDTEPWPQFSGALGIPRDSTGAFWMVMGGTQMPQGRNWTQPYLKPSGMPGFNIYQMEAKKGGGDGSDITEKKLDAFVTKFLKQLDQPGVLDGPETEEYAPDEELPEEPEPVKAAPTAQTKKPAGEQALKLHALRNILLAVHRQAPDVDLRAIVSKHAPEVDINMVLPMGKEEL